MEATGHSVAGYSFARFAVRYAESSRNCAKTDSVSETFVDRRNSSISEPFLGVHELIRNPSLG